jgi:hypothetical protein
VAVSRDTSITTSTDTERPGCSSAAGIVQVSALAGTAEQVTPA